MNAEHAEPAETESVNQDSQGSEVESSGLAALIVECAVDAMTASLLRLGSGVPVLIAVVVGIPVLQSTRPQTDLAGLLSAVGRYTADYEQQLSVVIGEEDYTQQAFRPAQSPGRLALPNGPMELQARRRLRSEFAILRLPTDEPRWTGFRDVFEVDGRPIPNHADRLSALFRLPFDIAEDQWRALEEESSRFNVGGIRRTVNVPTYVLLFLRAGNQSRFVFESPRTHEGSVIVDYREVERPTFIRDERGVDMPARGSFRAQLTSGAVETTRLTVGLARRDVQAQIDVRFRNDSKLGMLLPFEMREQYLAPSGERVDAVARYRNFKRFEVDASWKVRP